MLTPLVVVVGLNVPALDACVPVAGATLQVTPLASFVVAAIEKASAVAIAARATGTLTETAPAEEEDDAELDEEVDDDEELDVEAEEDEEEEEPLDPPPPQAERIVAQASMPAINDGNVQCDRKEWAARSRISGHLQQGIRPSLSATFVPTGSGCRLRQTARPARVAVRSRALRGAIPGGAGERRAGMSVLAVPRDQALGELLLA